MTQFFEWIIDFLTNISNIIQHTFTAVGQMYNIITSTIATYLTIIGTIPNWLRIYGTITLTVCSLYLIVGRDHE